MKKAMIIFGSMVLVATLSLPVLGKGPGGGFGYGRGDGPCRQNLQDKLDLTDEQVEQLENLHDQFITETSELRQSIRKSAREFATYMKSDSPDEATALELQKELNSLREQMMEKRLKMRLASLKIAPELKSLKGDKNGRGQGRYHGHHGKGKAWGGCQY